MKKTVSSFMAVLNTVNLFFVVVVFFSGSSDKLKFYKLVQRSRFIGSTGVNRECHKGSVQGSIYLQIKVLKL